MYLSNMLAPAKICPHIPMQLTEQEVAPPCGVDEIAMLGHDVGMSLVVIQYVLNTTVRIVLYMDTTSCGAMASAVPPS